MRKLDSKHWKSEEDLDGLLYFAQLVDEMLFDYTLDSYKPLALNGRLLCIEALETIDEIQEGYVPKKNLQPVLEELKWSLKKDYAAMAIFGVKFDQYLERIKPNDFRLKEIQNTIEFLYNSFNDRKYLNQIIKCLSESIKETKKKARIESLTGAFLTELINYGYHPNHIYYQNTNFFFNSSKKDKVTGISDLDEFFGLFDFKEDQEFTVVFIGGIIFRHFRDTLNSFNIVVTKTYNCFSKMEDDIAFKKSRLQDESFIICSKVLGFDHHSARQNAEKLIGQISGLFNFFHHKEKPQILDKCVVQRNSDNYVVIIDKPARPVLKTKTEEPPNAAAKSVEETLTKLNLSRESTYRFARSIDLHSAALTSNAIENQLLDLWAALETLLPKDNESGKDRIVQICEGLVPFLQLNYASKLLEELNKDLSIWDKRKKDSLLSEMNNYGDYSDIERIGALICLDTNTEIRLKFYDALEDFPLLKNRIFRLHESLSTPELITMTLQSHSTKINWHLRRIYRTRGLVVHSGKYPSYTSILIENLHNYIDLFIKRIIDLSTSQIITTIEQGVFETQVALKFQLELLNRHKGEQLNDENFKEALLGESKSS